MWPALLSNIYKRKRLYLYILLALLAVITVYCAWYANYYLSGNSDDIVYPYLFQHFKLNDIILPSQHANILKFPLYLIQSWLPYTFRTFSIVNIGLVVVTIVVWAYLMIWLIGKRYAPVICLALISILLGSQLFNYDILGTTIRNVEYPIMLGFVIFTAILVKSRSISRNKKILGGIIGLLYALTLAGDSFFIYTVVLSLIAILLLFWLKSTKSRQKDKRTLTLATFYVLGFSVLALIIRELVSVLGIAKYYTASVFLPHVLPISHIAPSITTASTQLLNIFNANIFGQRISPTNNLEFLNFILLIVGAIGLLFVLKDIFYAKRKDQIESLGIVRSFTISVLALAFFVNFFMYIASDSVVAQAASGAIVSSNQDRYLALMPLILVIGLAYLIFRSFKLKKLVYLGAPLLIILFILINSVHIKNSHVYINAMRQGEIAVADTAKENHIPLLLTGYWYGSTTRFWSDNTVQYASVAGCNIPQPSFNNRLSWYKPDPSIKFTALVIVRTGPDSIFWQCPDSQLKSIYGNPEKVININAPDHPIMWLYKYDARTKLLPMNY